MEKIAGGVLLLSFLYYGFVYLLALVAKKQKWIQRPIVRKRFFLKALNSSGIFVFIVGYGFMVYAYAKAFCNHRELSVEF